MNGCAELFHTFTTVGSPIPRSAAGVQRTFGWLKCSRSKHRVSSRGDAQPRISAGRLYSSIRVRPCYDRRNHTHSGRSSNTLALGKYRIAGRTGHYRARCDRWFCCWESHPAGTRAWAAGRPGTFANFCPAEEPAADDGRQTQERL